MVMLMCIIFSEEKLKIRLISVFYSPNQTSTHGWYMLVSQYLWLHQSSFQASTMKPVLDAIEIHPTPDSVAPRGNL